MLTIIRILTVSIFFLCGALSAGPLMHVEKVDSSSFPYTEIFAVVTNPYPEFVKNPEKNKFTIQEKIGNDNYSVPDFKLKLKGDSAEKIHVVMIVDATKSVSRSDFEKIVDHAEYMVSRLEKNDSAAIYKINGKPELISEFESDPEKLKKAISSIQREGKITRIHDALYSGMKTAHSVRESYESGDEDVSYKTAVFLFTDGRDEGSFLTKDDVVELSEFGDKNKIPVYTFLYGKSKNRNDYNRLTKKTGGMLFEIPSQKNIRKAADNLRQFDEIKFRISYGSIAGEKNILFPGTKIALKIKWSSGKSSDQIITHYEVPWSGFIKSVFSTAFAIGLLIAGFLIFGAAAFFFWKKKESKGNFESIYGKKIPPPPNLSHPLTPILPENEQDEGVNEKDTVYDLTDILNGRSEKIFSTATEDLKEISDENAKPEVTDIQEIITHKTAAREEEEPGEMDKAAIIYETGIEKEKIKNDPSNILREEMDEKKAILLKRHAYALLQTALRNARPYINAALVMSDEKSSKEYDLFMDSTVLGSGRWSHIHINDRTVSPIHARIKRVDNKYILYDMISEGGTYLNGKKLLRPKPLSDGDTVKLGRTELYFKGLPVDNL